MYRSKKRQSTTALWRKFTIIEEPDKATKKGKIMCNICGTKLVINQGSTTGMRAHLKRKHVAAHAEVIRADTAAKRQLDQDARELEVALAADDEYEAEKDTELNIVTVSQDFQFLHPRSVDYS